MRAPLSALYEALGAETGPLGYPLTGTTAVPGGLANRFGRGRVSWSAATGAHATRGAIAARYAELGAEGGPLGFPVAEERVEDDTPGPWRRPRAVPRRRSDFQRGSLVLDPRTGTVSQSART